MIPQKLAKDCNDPPCAFSIYELCSAYEAGDIAGGCGARNRWLIWFQEGFRDEHALKEITEFGIKRRVPEYQELSVTGFEGANYGAVEDGE